MYYTPAGWPIVDDFDPVHIVPVYTRDLANKLQNSDADVAAAINAAATVDAKIAAQLTSYGPHELPVTIASEGQWASVNGWPVEVKRVGKTVYMVGLRSVSGTPQATIATLPAWARPRRSWRFTTWAQNSKSTGLLEVQGNGNIVYIASLWSATPAGNVSFCTSWEAA